MKVNEIMTRKPITINADASLDVAADVMSKNDIGVLLAEENGKIRGVLTDRDITLRAVAAKRDPLLTRVGDIMTTNVFACFDDQDVSEVAKEMEDKQIRRVVVYNHSNDLVGIVSLGDIVEHGAKETAAEVLEVVSAPVHSMAREKQPHPERNI